MAAESHNISFRSSNLHYKRFGHGPEWLFCFHGYGEDADSFLMMEKWLDQRFTIIAFDFPIHGKTNWNEGLLFEPHDLISIIDLIKPENKKIHMLAYSMGGRVALQLLQVMPEQIASLVLMAPDGLHKNKWQWLATKTKIGNLIFRSVMKNPFLLMSVLDFAGKINLYNKSLLKFVHYYLDDAEQRNILYRRWTTMRKFRPDKQILKSAINKHKITVTIVFGKYDRVILTKHGSTFSKGVEELIKVIELEAGHQLLREKHAAFIANILLKS